jgi:hypothetical protein
MYLVAGQNRPLMRVYCLSLSKLVGKWWLWNVHWESRAYNQRVIREKHIFPGHGCIVNLSQPWLMQMCCYWSKVDWGRWWLLSCLWKLVLCQGDQVQTSPWWEIRTTRSLVNKCSEATLPRQPGRYDWPYPTGGLGWPKPHCLAFPIFSFGGFI